MIILSLKVAKYELKVNVSETEVLLNCTWWSYLSIDLVFLTCSQSRISVCLFCLLETTSLNEFMESLPKSEYWHFKISWKHCQKTKILISRRDLTWSLTEILGDVLAAMIWNLAKILLEILPRFSASLWPPRFWDLAEISARILTRFWELARISARFWDFKISPRSRQESRRVFGLRDFEIFPRSHLDLGNLASQKLPEILAEISVNFPGIGI